MAKNLEMKATLDASPAERSLRDLKNSLDRVKGTADRAIGALAGIAGAVGFGAMVKQSLDLAGALSDASEALGMSASALATLQKGAQLAGIDAEQLNSTLFKMSKNINEGLSKSTSGAAKAFKELGINTQELANMSPDEQFNKLTESLLEIPNATDRVALSMEVFGKTGPKILKVAEEARNFKKELEDLGIKLTDLDIKVLDDAGDAVDKAGLKLKEGFMKALVALTPAIISVANAIGNMAPYIVAVTNALIELAPYMAIAFGGVVVANIGRIAAALAGPVVNALRAVIAVMAANPIMAILTALVMLGTFIYTKFVAPLKDAGETAGTIFAYVADKMVNYILNGLEILVTIVPRTFKMLYNAAKKIWSGEDIGEALSQSFSQALTDIKTDWNKRRVKFVSDDELARLDKVRDDYKKVGDSAETAGQKGAAAAVRMTEEQQKALDALKDTIDKLKVQADYQLNVVRLGEDEANIVKLIAEERDKLAKVGLTLSAQQEQSLRNAQQELNVATQLNKQKERLKTLNEEYNVLAGADPRVLKAQEDLNKARKALAEASSDEQKKIAQAQFNEFAMFYQHEVKARAMSLTDMGKAYQEYENKIWQIRTAQQDLTAAGYALESQEYMNLAAQKIQIERDYQAKITQIQLDNIAARMNAERNAIAGSISENDRKVLQEAGQAEKQKQYTASRMEFEKKSDAEKAAFAIDQGAQMFTALGAQNRKAFEAAKAFNIANAIMNTYMGATKALASYPPPFNFIAAAATVAMGFAQVAQIRSQQYSGRQLGGPVMGGTPYIVGENGPELFTPNTTGSITRNGDLGGGGGVTNVNFTINAVDATGIDNLLVDRKATIQQIISDAMMEKGQRM